MGADKSSRSAAPEVYQQPDFPPAVPANRPGSPPLTMLETAYFYLFEGMGRNSHIHDSPKDWPYPPRNVRQKATLASRLQSITDSWVKERRRER